MVRVHCRVTQIITNGPDIKALSDKGDLEPCDLPKHQTKQLLEETISNNLLAGSDSTIIYNPFWHLMVEQRCCFPWACTLNHPL